MISAAGIIFSNIHDKSIAELTQKRTMASVPFGGRYRLVDFPLSGMVNAGIVNISVITHDNYLSLMEHIGSGKDWDLSRRSGGIRILAPFVTAYANYHKELYKTRLEALASIRHSISTMKEDAVILSDCDGICNMDLRDMLRAHEKKEADLTVAVKKIDIDERNANDHIILTSNEEGRMTDILVHPYTYERCRADVNINIWVINRLYLLRALQNAQAHGYNSFSRDVISRNIAKDKMFVYRFEGYYASINSITEYYDNSMQLLHDKKIREELFHNPHRPILTKVRNSAPTKHSAGAVVKNSMIADGCVIEGTVENSILFRGVKIGKGTEIRNSILFMDAYVGENVQLDHVIADKYVLFRDGVRLAGHARHPLCVEKGTVL